MTCNCPGCSACSSHCRTLAQTALSYAGYCKKCARSWVCQRCHRVAVVHTAAQRYCDDCLDKRADWCNCSGCTRQPKVCPRLKKREPKYAGYCKGCAGQWPCPQFKGILEGSPAGGSPPLLVRWTLEAADRQFGIAPGSPSDMVFIAFERFQADFLMFWDPWGLGGVWQGSGWGLGGSERGLVLSIEPCAPRHGVAGEVRERSGRDLGGIWVRLCAVQEGSGIEPCAPRHGVAGLWRAPRHGWLHFGGG